MQNLIQKLRDLKPRLDAAVDNFLAVKKNRIFARVVCCISAVLLLFALASPFILASVQASAEEDYSSSHYDIGSYEVVELSHIAFCGYLNMPSEYDHSLFDLEGVVWTGDSEYFYFNSIGIYYDSDAKVCTMSFFLDRYSVYTAWPHNYVILHIVGGEDSLDSSALSFFNDQPSFDLIGDDIPSSLYGSWTFSETSWSFGVTEWDLSGYYFYGVTDYPFIFDRVVSGYSLELGDDSQYSTFYYGEIGNTFRTSTTSSTYYFSGGEDLDDPFLCLLCYIYSVYSSSDLPYVLTEWILLDNVSFSSSAFTSIVFSYCDVWVPFLSAYHTLDSISFESYPVYHFSDGSTFALSESSPLEYYLLWIGPYDPLYVEPGSFADNVFSSYVPGSFDFDIGYETGFVNGYGEGLTESFLGNFFGEIVSALDSLTIVFGYSILGIISAVLGIMFVLWILKLISGR